MRRLVVRRGLAVAVVIAALVGCGVNAEDEPRRIKTGDVPFGLLSSPPPSESTRSWAAAKPHLYFVRGDKLVAVVRPLPSTGPRELLEALLAGPTREETASGLRSAVSAETKVRDVRMSAPVVTLDLGKGILQVRGQEQILALAQLVYTVTDAPGVQSVRFMVDGTPLQVPLGKGELTDRPVTRADYRPLVGR